MFRPQTLFETKSALLSIIIFSLIAALSIPVILPHLFQNFELFHILLHISGIGFASFLTVVAAMAYHKIKTRRLFFTTIAFGTFILSEIFSLVDAAWQSKYYFWAFSSDEVGHLIMFCTLLIFALSVFRRD
ncbi:MAG TPA: hypothetical protein VJR22_04945 [Candidatus Nitrosotalea sp.]|nr:hypothetical protein [Candidatus Nitrosotalea sp.]